MYLIRIALTLIFALSICNARDITFLRYKAKLKLSDHDQPVEIRFTVTIEHVLKTANRKKKPRFASWQLTALQTNGENITINAMLARLERLLYISGPVPETIKTDIIIKYPGKSCQLWKLKVPKLHYTYAYLAELTPHLLALSYLSCNFLIGNLQSAEIQLEDFNLGPNFQPPEFGQALLFTLQNIATTSRGEELEVVRIE